MPFPDLGTPIRRQGAFRNAVMVCSASLLFTAVRAEGSRPFYPVVNDTKGIETILNGAEWKITFPVAGPKGNALEMLNPDFSDCLQNNCTFPGALGNYLYRTPEGLVFHTEYTGVTTSSKTKYSRTELREMEGKNEANWRRTELHRLEARLKISALEGGANKLFFMQIHGKAPASEPLLKCIWEKGFIRLLTKTGPRLNNLSRRQTYTAVGLNEWFTCAIDVTPDELAIQINGKTVETYGRDVLDFWPSENTFYFKAGNYLQSNRPGAAATVVFSSIIKTAEPPHKP